MDQLNIHEVKQNLSAILKRVQSGETIIIANYNKPIAEIRPIERPSKKSRLIGLSKGEIQISANFNDPLPDEILDEFEGKNLV
jgi:prevent-host-death family protein